MVDYMILVAYAVTFGVPALILGFGAMINENKSSLVLAYINMIALLAYFLNKGLIPVWILVLVTIVISLLLTMMYKSVLGGD